MDRMPAGARLRVFLRWLVSPSWVMLTAMLFVVASGLAIAMGPPSIAYHLQQLLTGGETYARTDLRIFNQLSRLKAAAGMSPVIAYVGGSTSRESLLSEVALEDAIVAHGGPQTLVFDLTSDSQRMLTTWAIAEVAACSGADIVVVGVSQNRLRNASVNHPIDQTRYLEADVTEYIASGQWSPRRAAKGSNMAREFRAQYGLLIKVAEAALGQEPTEAVQKSRMRGIHRFEGRTPLELPGALEELEGRVAGRSGMLGEHLELLVRSVKRCMAEPVIVMSAIHPGFASESFPLTEAATRDLGEIVRNSGVAADAVIDLNTLQLPAEAFHDWGHFNSREAMAETTDMLGQKLAAVLGAEL